MSQLKKRKISVVTGARAEFGLLSKLIGYLHSDSNVDLDLVVTGSHLSEKYGNTYKEVEEAGFKISHKIPISLEDNSPVGVLNSIAELTQKLAKYYEKNIPDIVVILGDRYELLAIAQTATLLRIPIAHIHGGEITEGLIDEAIRHSLTKMSHLHFCSSEVYKNRVIQMGEQPNHVFNSGAPGVDNIMETKLLDKASLEKELKIKLNKDVLLVTYHPVTLNGEKDYKSVDELMSALETFLDVSIVFTMPNSDPSSDYTATKIQQFCKNHSNAFAFSSLGNLKYLSMVKASSAVVGNSSSGLIEAPYLETPTVNIGIRQRGRLSGNTVIHTQDVKSEIMNAIQKTLNPDFRKNLNFKEHLYGTGSSSQFIYKTVTSIDLKNILFKKFYETERR